MVFKQNGKETHKMTFQERLKSLSDYKISLRIYDGNYVIAMIYDENWAVLNTSEESAIGVYQDENNKSLYYYTAPLTTDVDSIFEIIDETISYNKELEAKAALLNEKIEELKELFVQLPYERLKNMEFIERPTMPLSTDGEKKVGKKRGRKKTNETTVKQPKAEEEVQESDIDRKIDELLKNG